MFSGASNQVGGCNFKTSGAKYMSHVFSDARKFNKPLWWSTDNVVDMAYMFENAQAFTNGDKPLRWWDVDNVKYAENMFKGASSFNQNMCSWGAEFSANIKDRRDVAGMFSGSNCTTTKTPWLHPDGVTTMCNVCNEPTFSCLPDGDALRDAVDEYTGAFMGNKEFTSAAHVYGLEMEDWCVSGVTDFSWVFAFRNYNGDLTKWDVSSATDMNHMFYENGKFNRNLGVWDVSKVTDMVRLSFLFLRAAFEARETSWYLTPNFLHFFLRPIQSGMFGKAEDFTGDGIKDWDTSKVENFQGMFAGAEQMYAWLSGWDTSSATDMSFMFSRTERFNSALKNWDVAKVSDMRASKCTGIVPKLLFL